MSLCVKSASKRRSVPCIELDVAILIHNAQFLRHMEMLSRQNVLAPAAAGGILTGPHRQYWHASRGGSMRELPPDGYANEGAVVESAWPAPCSQHHPPQQWATVLCTVHVHDAAQASLCSRARLRPHVHASRRACKHERWHAGSEQLSWLSAHACALRSRRSVSALAEL